MKQDIKRKEVFTRPYHGDAGKKHAKKAIPRTVDQRLTDLK
jgi:hypothetical protein